MDRPDFSTDGLLAWAGSLPGQLTGLTLVLAPAVVHPLPMDGGLRVVVQLLTVIAGSAGAIVVFAGLLTRVRAGEAPVSRTTWLTGLALTLALMVGAAVCLLRTFSDEQYLAATVMFALPAAALAGLLRWTRTEGDPPEH